MGQGRDAPADAERQGQAQPPRASMDGDTAFHGGVTSAPKCFLFRALEFTILTAARTSEVINATWDEFDLDEKVWSIPAERMKSHRPHRIPLSARAVELLQSLPREDSTYVFIGFRGGQPLSNMAMLQLLRNLAPGSTTHGFRSSFKDWSTEATHIPNMVSEAALAHIVADKTEAAYRRGDLFIKRAKLMTDWADYCGSEPAEVVSLPKEPEGEGIMKRKGGKQPGAGRPGGSTKPEGRMESPSHT